MAFFKGSYYELLRVFDPPEDGSAPFRGVRARPIANPEPILEHVVAVGDRVDSLGQHYYANPRDWRRIADANPDVLFPEDLVYDPDADPAALTRDAPIRERLGAVLLVPRRREGR
jgi:nucleoid-associated protein YgaU